MDDLKRLAEELERIDQFMVRTQKDFNYLLEKVHVSNRKCAVNLLHYLALRSLDIRDLQDSLHKYGLSSMASSESHIRGQLLAILQRIGVETDLEDDGFDYEKSKESFVQRTNALFGKKRSESIPWIMVTFDSDFADDVGMPCFPRMRSYCIFVRTSSASRLLDPTMTRNCCVLMEQSS